MHTMDGNEAHGEKAIWELHKNVTCCLSKLLEATLHRPAIVRPHNPIPQTIQLRRTIHAGHW